MENKIEFCTTDSTLHSTWVMRITKDRRIEVNEDVEVTEAAKKVLETMQHMLTPQRKPLTDEQMWVLWNSQGDDAMEQQAAIAFARAIEAAHNIKE